MPTFTYAINAEEQYQRFAAAVDRAITYNEKDEADAFCLFYEVFRRENPAFATMEAEWAAKYEALYRKARWVALPMLFDDDDVVEMFKTQVKSMLELPEFDLLEQFRVRVITLPVPERDDFKSKIKDALLNNQEKLTDEFESTVLHTRAKGTIGDWVKDFQAFVGGKFGDALAVARYYTESKAYGAQKPEIKEFLKMLFHLFSRLNLSSLTAAGFEEDRLLEVEGEPALFRPGGVIESFDSELVAILKKMETDEGAVQDPRVQIRKKFADPPEFAKAVAAAAAKIKPGGEKDALYDALVPPAGGAIRSETVVAALRALAKIGSFMNVLTDRRLQDLVRQYYEKKGRTIESDSLKVFPNAPEHIRGFLQMCFEDRLSMDENEAARQTLQLANIMRLQKDDRLMSFAAYDERAGAFRWHKESRPV